MGAWVGVRFLHKGLCMGCVAQAGASCECVPLPGSEIQDWAGGMLLARGAGSLRSTAGTRRHTRTGDLGALRRPVVGPGDRVPDGWRAPREQKRARAATAGRGGSSARLRRT